MVVVTVESANKLVKKMKPIDKAINYLKTINKVDTSDVYLSKEKIFRALMNITMPTSLTDDYYLNQDLVLQEYYSKEKVIDVNDLNYTNNIAIYKGDITLIKADAIVNACNCELLGCFHPLHNCIDNAIHSFAGLQMRRDLITIMKDKEYEQNGKCEVTKGYNLPSNYVFHTVGPIVNGSVKEQDVIDLTSCYLSCLKKAKEMNLKSIVFCSIATGIYSFPIALASEIAITTVNNYLQENNIDIKVIFNVLSESDYKVYEQTFNRIIK